MKKECVAMLLAGGQGSRLYVLTGDMAKPAVPFGGKFRRARHLKAPRGSESTSAATTQRSVFSDSKW